MGVDPRLLRPVDRGGFDPRSIAGLAGWWDFSDSSAANMTTSGGSPNAISFIADKSGGGRNLSQSDPARQPSLVSASMGGLSAASFSVDNLDAANFPSSTSITAFAVARRAAWNPVLNFMAGRGYAVTSGFAVFGTAGNNFVGSSVAGEIQCVANGFFTSTPRAPAAYGPWASAVNTAGGNVMSTVLSAAESGVWLNGTNITRVSLTGTDANYATGTFVLGNNGVGGDWSDYTVGEFLIFTSSLTAADRQRVEGYLAWKWGVQARLPYNHPYAASFPGYGSQTMPTDSDALTYLAAVATADGGTGVEVGVANAVDDFVKGCKADGIWSAIKASCILSGARTLSGALVPLVGLAPLNNAPGGAFVSSDYNRKTGLVGNSTSKRLDSNRSNSADPETSRHMAVYASQRSTATALYIATTSINTNGDSYLYQDNTGGVNSAKLSSAGAAPTASGTNLTAGLYGASRASSSQITIRRAGANVPQNVDSVAPINENLMVFGVPGFYANARLAFYSIGESLDLALLDTRVTALYTAIGAAIP